MTRNFKGLKILLVENDETALKVHTMMIEEINGLPDFARTGKEALLKASKEQYDLIFMDIGLSDIDGIEVTHKIRRLEELNESKSAVIIGLTAFDLDDVQPECLTAGMNQVIQKPVSFAMLQDLIRLYRNQKSAVLTP